jgi:Leucine-rich repeat (LRR) protein
MGVAVQASASLAPAPQQIPQGSTPKAPLLRIATDVFQTILSFVDERTSAAICRDFRTAVDTAIKRAWSRFDLKSHPYIREALSGKAPSTSKELKSLVDAMKRQSFHLSMHRGEKYTFAVMKDRCRIEADKIYEAEEASSKQALKQNESDQNLKFIFEGIALALNMPQPELSPLEIKQWLLDHAEDLARITELDLSNKYLTMIPEEFSTLPLPNLKVLNLSQNRIKAFPDHFGAGWKKLQVLNLAWNQIQFLTNNFGNNWNQLLSLDLALNPLSTLPNHFGANWPWWNERREEVLAGNPILTALFRPERNEAPMHKPEELEQGPITPAQMKYRIWWFQRRKDHLLERRRSDLADVISKVDTSFSALKDKLVQNVLKAKAKRSSHIPRALNTIGDSFSPVKFVALENAARQAESDRNLQLIWYNLMRRLDFESGPKSCDQIRHFLQTNPNELARLTDLNLSSLGLTMIPEEFSSLTFPNLTQLDLSGNQLKFLPNGFGRTWNQLETLNLARNQLQTLPDNFGTNWPWWNDRRNEVLAGNPILNPAPVLQPIPAPPKAQNPPLISPVPEPSVHKNQQALMTRDAVHILSTAALSLFASYVFSSKIPLALGAVYLGHRYTRDVLWE